MLHQSWPQGTKDGDPNRYPGQDCLLGLKQGTFGALKTRWALFIPKIPESYPLAARVALEKIWAGGPDQGPQHVESVPRLGA